MELGGIVEHMKDKSILITGATGFLAKIFVEKVLRVQPNVKKLFLLVRATDAKSAAHRVQTEIIAKDLFKVLREKHGKEFSSFISEKLFPIEGDIVFENLGIEDADLRKTLWNEIDIVVNVAATTNFCERYDVALDINVFGPKHVLEFSKKCLKLQVLLHVSTAFVAGMKDGLILEEPFHLGKTLKEDMDLDIEAELRLVDQRKKELLADKSLKSVEKIAMKELGLKRARDFGWPNTYVFTKAMGEMLLGHSRGDIPLVILRPTIITSIYKEPLPGWMEGTRTIDAFIIGYAKGKLTCLFGDRELIMDVIPGDMVVNAMIVTMVAHLNQRSEFIYHVCSSIRNPVKYSILEDCGYHYFDKNPRIGKDGKMIRTKRIPVLRTMSSFHGYMALRYKLPLEVLHLVNWVFCGLLSQWYNEFKRKYNFAMHLAELYEPYAFFRGSFDDIKLERLRMALEKESEEATVFDFDPKHIDWHNYFCNIHIPGVLKYLCK